MSHVILFAIFFFGLSIGSFLNVVIYRMLNGDSPTRGRSYCDHCKRQLSWYENIPLVSYVALRGKCRTCKKKIDWSYPMVELVTGLLFLWWATLGFAFFSLSQAPLTYLQPMYWLMVGLILVLIFFVDLIYGIIPDNAIASLAVITMVYRVVLVSVGEMQMNDFVWSMLSAVGAVVFFGGMYVATKGKGIGFGDVKFAPVMGFLLGFPKSVVGFFLSFLIGGIMASVLLVGKKKKFGQKVPFGPFLVIGLLIALMWGEELWFWYVGML